MDINNKKVAIIGSRTLSPVITLAGTPALIISGGAKGVDTAAAEYAKQHNIELLELRPDYAKHGRGAPHIRNRQIVDECDCVIAFWDGKSKGTQSTVSYAKKQGKPVEIVQL